MRIDDIKESALMAFDTLRTNKLRSLLTILGVTVGVVTVIFMVSIIQGLNKAFAQQIEALGSNAIWATKFDPSFGHQPTSEETHRKDLTLEDADAIRNEAPSVLSVSPIRRKIAETVRYADKQSDTPIVIGATPYYEFTQSSYVDRGRFITDTDIRERTNICVLGKDLVKALFPYEDPIDKELKINGKPFHVVGVMEPLGTFLGQSRDNQVFIPITTFAKYYPGEQPFPEVVFVIIVRPKSRAYVKSAIDEMTDILRRRRRDPTGAPSTFGISSQDALLDIYNQLTGATAVVLTAFGGVIGLVLGELASLLTNKYSPLPAFVPMWAIVVGIGISAAVGIIFGLWPAWKAAKLDPIEALRWE